MARLIDEQLWETWRRRLSRYEQWSGTISAFCEREGVSTAAFFQWRRKLDGDLGGGETRSARRAGGATETPRFLPVRIAPAEPIEIELPNGVRVRVPGNSAGSLDAVLTAAARCLVAASSAETRAC